VGPLKGLNTYDHAGTVRGSICNWCWADVGDSTLEGEEGAADKTEEEEEAAATFTERGAG
jgi:hypothetical protein